VQHTPRRAVNGCSGGASATQQRLPGTAVHTTGTMVPGGWRGGDGGVVVLVLVGRKTFVLVLLGRKAFVANKML
jgi:hypothetical protein